MNDQVSPTPGSTEAIARTPDGTIADQSTILTEAGTTTPTTEPAKTDPPAPAEADKTILNEGVEDPPKADGPPEKYEFKLPDGFTLDEETNTEVQSLFKDLALPAEGAQKLVDFYTSQMQKLADAPVKLWTDTQKQWQDEIKADPVIGKILPEVRTTVAKAIDGLGDPKLAGEFRKAMDITGAGNNPAFIRAFFKLAQQVTEGKQVVGGGPSPEGQKGPGNRPANAATALYPNNP